jgi:hypothetical protein
VSKPAFLPFNSNVCFNYTFESGRVNEFLE